MKEIKENLVNVRLGLVFTFATLGLGLFLGVVFGAFEDDIKDVLHARAMTAYHNVYFDDMGEVDRVVEKSWEYFKRAHYHSYAIGTITLILVFLISIFNRKKVANILSLVLAISSFGYSVYWLWAGIKAPILGSTTLAKESLSWFAMPMAGIYGLCSMIVFLIVIITLYKNKFKKN